MIENTILFNEFQRLSQATVLCIGDIMLDRFVYGKVDRISPEAPIPVFLVDREKEMLGGAGNVVSNIASLGAKAMLISVIGRDANGDTTARLLKEQGITATLEIADDRQTIVKTRFIGAGQQMLRVDREKSATLPAEVEAKLLSHARTMMKQAGAVILSDYGKGVLSNNLIRAIIEEARQQGIPVIVDPKGTDFTRYYGAAVITPNRKELEAATAMKASNGDEVKKAAEHLLSTCGLKAVLATRSQDGMSLVETNDQILHVPSEVREIFDVSGAGDTVIASFASAVAAGISFRNAAFLSNIAAGIAVGKAGTATVRPDEMLEAIDHAKNTTKHRTHAKGSAISTLAAAVEQAERWRLRGFKVGFTNGCFDLLHPGHLSTLRQSKAACDYLIVAINTDSSVKRLKGPTRPVQDEVARASILSALEMVDMVVTFDAETPIELIRAIKPDVLIKGGQYKLEEVVGYDVVSSYGGRVVRADMEEGFSTTNTISRMLG